MASQTFWLAIFLFTLSLRERYGTALLRCPPSLAINMVPGTHRRNLEDGSPRLASASNSSFQAGE